MTNQPTLLVGPYLLVRLHRSAFLRIYDIHSAETNNRLATMHRTNAPDLGIKDHTVIQCRGTNCSARKEYPTRDAALRWLGYHRVTKHPYEVKLEAA